MAGLDWCPECRAPQTVEDTYTESRYVGGSGGASEMTVTVFDLACGHQTTTRPVRTGSAPGAPYAGRETVVAATHHPADLYAARQQQARLDADPWSDQ